MREVVPCEVVEEGGGDDKKNRMGCLDSTDRFVGRTSIEKLHLQSENKNRDTREKRTIESILEYGHAAKIMEDMFSLVCFQKIANQQQHNEPLFVWLFDLCVIIVLSFN